MAGSGYKLEVRRFDVVLNQAHAGLVVTQPSGQQTYIKNWYIKNWGRVAIV
jgi:hypothetical protein